MFFQSWLNGFNKLKAPVQLVTQKALCVMSYEVICNLKEMKLHHIYTLIYAMTLAKQISNIQNNIGVNHSHKKYFVVTDKVKCSSHISSEVTIH